jgi:hypothetical protein
MGSWQYLLYGRLRWGVDSTSYIVDSDGESTVTYYTVGSNEESTVTYYIVDSDGESAVTFTFYVDGSIREPTVLVII